MGEHLVMSKDPSQPRIEIVDWSDSAAESSQEQNSQCSSVSLSQLMMGSTGGDKSTDQTKLTIDNLWKILAQQKPGGPEPPNRERIQER